MNKNKLTAALKKKALGAAIAVAISTPAFADVTMFGIVDVGIGRKVIQTSRYVVEKVEQLNFHLFGELRVLRTSEAD